MKKLILAMGFLFFSSQALAAMAMFSHSEIVGSTKICYYTYMGKTFYMQTSAYSSCPSYINI